MVKPTSVRVIIFIILLSIIVTYLPATPESRGISGPPPPGWNPPEWDVSDPHSTTGFTDVVVRRDGTQEYTLPRGAEGMITYTIRSVDISLPTYPVNFTFTLSIQRGVVSPPQNETALRARGVSVSYSPQNPLMLEANKTADLKITLRTDANAPDDLYRISVWGEVMNSVNNKSETYSLSDLWLRVGDWKPEGEFTVLYHTDNRYFLPELPKVLNVTKGRYDVDQILVLSLKSEVNRTITPITYNILDPRTGNTISIPNVKLTNDTYSEGGPAILPLGYYEIRFFFSLSKGAVNGEYPALVVVNSTNYRVAKPIIIAIRGGGSATTGGQPKTVVTTTVYLTTTVTSYLNTSRVISTADAATNAGTATQYGADTTADPLQQSSIGIGIAVAAGIALAVFVLRARRRELNTTSR